VLDAAMPRLGCRGAWESQPPMGMQHAPHTLTPGEQTGPILKHRATFKVATLFAAGTRARIDLCCDRHKFPPEVS